MVIGERIYYGIYQGLGPIPILGLRGCCYESLLKSLPVGFWKTLRSNSGMTASRWSKMSDWMAS